MGNRLPLGTCACQYKNVNLGDENMSNGIAYILNDFIQYEKRGKKRIYKGCKKYKMN